MTCTWCGANDHERSRCPWPTHFKGASMRLASTLLLAAALSGCTGLQTAWRLQLDMRYVTPDDTPAAPALPKPASGT
jgi:hypothetical protein